MFTMFSINFMPRHALLSLLVRERGPWETNVMVLKCGLVPMWWADEDNQGLSAGCLVQPDSAVTTRKWSGMQNLEPIWYRMGTIAPDLPKDCVQLLYRVGTSSTLNENQP